MAIDTARISALRNESLAPKPRLRPFFSYFGSKCRVASTYPIPKYKTIIEPFAGAAGYSTLWHDRKVILWDVSEHIYGVWNFLINESELYVRSIPGFVNNVDDLVGYPQEVKWLVGFWNSPATSVPRRRASTWARESRGWCINIRDRIAASLKFIRHWRVNLGSYCDSESERATRFIDPPYILHGANYKHSSIDYNYLSGWCRRANGQCIVCEQHGANWLPFRDHTVIQTNASRNGRKKSKEVIWTK